MPGLKEQQRPLIPCEGVVAALVGVAQPGSGGVIAVLVRKTPLDDEDFLAAMMRVLLEWRVGCPANHCHKFVPKLMQGHRLEPGR